MTLPSDPGSDGPRPARPRHQGIQNHPEAVNHRAQHGRLMYHRKLARDYERHPHRSEAMIHLAMIDLMARRLTGETTLNWRGT